jgi:hypothetical protein
MSRSTLALAALTLAGCNVNEDTFAYKFAVVYCRHLRRCEPGDWEDWYDELEDCVDDAERAFALIQDGAELFCDIDYQIASECYRKSKLASCDTWDDPDEQPEACEDYVVCGF